MRTIVDLPDEQIRALADLCRAEGISRAEAVRRALGEMIASRKSSSRDAAFGAWSGAKIDGRDLIAKLREEWES